MWAFGNWSIFTFTQGAAIIILLQFSSIAFETLWGASVQRAKLFGFGFFFFLRAAFFLYAVSFLSHPHVVWAGTTDDAVVSAESGSVLTATKRACGTTFVPNLVAWALMFWFLLFHAFTQGAAVFILLQ